MKSYSSPDTKIFLIGNKLDLEDKRVVPIEKGNAIKTDFELDLFMECSAKDGRNAEYIFVQAAKLLYNDYIKYRIGNPQIGRTKAKENKVKKSNNNRKKNNCC